MLLGLVVAVLAAVTLSVAVGPLSITPSTVWRVVAWHLSGIGDTSLWDPVEADIVWNLRLPRALLGVVVGAGLSAVGVVVQALVRNPLADPWLLGVSQGASVGAVAFIVLGIGAFGVPSTSAAAFAGAAVSFAALYVFARRGGSMAPLRLVLAGVAIGYVLYAVANFLVLLADNPGQTNTALFWLLGSLASAQWSNLALPAVTVALVLVVLGGSTRTLNGLMVGDETAASLGIGVERVRRGLLACAALIIGVVVAVSGAIGFVGLVVPHAVRLVVGADHRRLLPATILAGGAFMVVADVVARTALAPRELPIGIVTAVVGGPVFLGLMSRRRDLGAPA